MNCPTLGHKSSLYHISIGTLRLLRLSNSIPAGILVPLGAYLVGIDLRTPSIWVAAVTMWCITAFGYVSNDYVDVVEDRINKPDRPIPADLVSARFAIWLAISLSGCAILLSIWLGTVALIAAVSVLLLLTAYNIWLKGTPGSGNLMIALFAGCTLLVGSVAVNGLTYKAIQPVLLPGCLLAIFIAAREILKTIEDVEGDQYVGKQTLAIRWGTDYALGVIAVLTSILILLSVLPVLYLNYSWLYLVVMGIGVNLPLLYTIITLWKDRSPSLVSRCLALLKGSYFAGILALLLSQM